MVRGISIKDVIKSIKNNSIKKLEVIPHKLGSEEITLLIKAANESKSTVKMNLTCFGLDRGSEEMLRDLPGIQCTILDSHPRVVNLDESIPIATRVSADGGESYGSPGHQFLAKYLDGRAERVDLSLAEVIRIIKGNMVNSLELPVHRESSSYIDALIKIAYESKSTVKMNLTCCGLYQGSEEMLGHLPSIQCTILDSHPRVVNLDESTVNINSSDTPECEIAGLPSEVDSATATS